MICKDCPHKRDIQHGPDPKNIFYGCDFGVGMICPQDLVHPRCPLKQTTDPLLTLSKQPSAGTATEDDE